MRKSFRRIHLLFFRPVYLCGGINGLNDSQCRDWREYSKDLLWRSTLDPMRRDYRGVEASAYREIVRKDLADILFSGVILVLATRPSWGTAMEIVFAWLMGKTIVAIVPEHAPISPWLQFFTDIRLLDVERACNAINNL